MLKFIETLRRNWQRELISAKNTLKSSKKPLRVTKKKKDQMKAENQQSLAQWPVSTRKEDQWLLNLEWIVHTINLMMISSVSWSINLTKSKENYRKPRQSMITSRETMLNSKKRWIYQGRNTREQLCWWQSSWMISLTRTLIFLKMIPICMWISRRSRRPQSKS